jgi:integrase
MMRLAALTGMRLTEIGGLRVKGIAQGLFHVEESKTRSGVRVVPVHPDLSALVERRTKGKSDTDFLIEELSSPPSHGGLRGKKVGEAFTAYRRTLRLDQRQTGRKQSDVDFHSFRRWFVTKAEQAGYTEVQVARVVGHKPPGFTFSTYSGGLADAQAAELVRSVRLPPDAPVEPPEAPSGGGKERRPTTASSAAGKPR